MLSREPPSFYKQEEGEMETKRKKERARDKEKNSNILWVLFILISFFSISFNSFIEVLSSGPLWLSDSLFV